jgi:enamine deaminase RidA (YjgF/YER057c/UK114 family)
MMDGGMMWGMGLLGLLVIIVLLLATAALVKYMFFSGGKYITDARYGDRFTQLRKEIFGDNFPASALITVAGLARAEMLVEVQGIAALG